MAANNNVNVELGPDPPVMVALGVAGFTRNEARILMDDGFRSLETFKRLKESKIEKMAATFTKRTPIARRVNIDADRVLNLVGIMHWTQDFDRVNKPIDINELDEESLTEALQRAEAREAFSKTSDSMSRSVDPGKLKDAKGWIEWSRCFRNLLQATPGAFGVPLSYVIREKESPDDDEVFDDWMEETIARAPLRGPIYEIDKRRVHQLITSFTQDQPSAQHILDIEGKQNGRLDFERLRAYYGGRGNQTRQVSRADTLNKSLHYRGERSMRFEDFSSHMREMFNIYDLQGEPLTEAAKVRTLLQRIQCPHMLGTVNAIQTKIDIEGEVPYLSVLNMLSAAAAKTPDAALSRKVSQVDRKFKDRPKKKFNRGGKGKSTHNRSVDDPFGIKPIPRHQWKKMSHAEKTERLGAPQRKVEELVTQSITRAISEIDVTAFNGTTSGDNSAGATAVSAGQQFGGKKAAIMAKLSVLAKEKVAESLNSNNSQS